MKLITIELERSSLLIAIVFEMYRFMRCIDLCKDLLFATDNYRCTTPSTIFGKSAWTGHYDHSTSSYKSARFVDLCLIITLIVLGEH